MELRFCDECGSRISDNAFSEGKAFESEEICYCPKCYRKKQKQGDAPAPAGTAEQSRTKPASATRLKRATPGGGSKPGAKVRRDTPATTKLPARPRKTRASTSKMSLPAARRKHPSSGRLARVGDGESEAANWGRTVFNGIMLLVGGLLLGYLGLMLFRRQGNPPGRKPAVRKTVPTPKPKPTVETKTEPKGEPKPEPKTEPKTEPEGEPKPKPKPDPAKSTAKIEVEGYAGPQASRPIVHAAGSEGRMREGAVYVPGSRHTWSALPAELQDKARVVLRTKGQGAKCVVKLSGSYRVFVLTHRDHAKKPDWLGETWEQVRKWKVGTRVVAAKQNYGYYKVWRNKNLVSNKMTLSYDTQMGRPVTYVFAPEEAPPGPPPAPPTKSEKKG
jgi:hypothetical protein